MATPATISKAAPELESMQYETLRAAGMERIIKWSETLWTDHNEHDPGITILEALCYAITDLGYRLNFGIKDLLAAAPDDTTDYQNFFTARQILHNAPLTINDYRKLLMDVVIEETTPAGTELLGVKNAWLEISPDAEVRIYANLLKSYLEHTQTYATETSYFVKGLYNILLEFDESGTYGDLNENKIEATYQVENHPADGNMEGVQFHLVIGFPRWDNLNIDFSDNSSIQDGIETVEILVEEEPSSYNITAVYNAATKRIELTGQRLTGTGLEPIPGLGTIETDLNNFAFGTSADSLIEIYKDKIAVINRIVEAAGEKLNAHRNLCEDFYKVKALRVEQILLCADIDITNTADTNKVAAAIFHDIAEFLSPTVYFYSLEEMQAKGYNSDEIFDGPALEHGFIDTAELEATERAKCIHASDLIRIIMDVEVDGKKPVIAVSNLQIANKPEDNADGSIDEKSVRWCLELAYDELYVPRLSEELSSLSFYKDSIPFGYDEDEMLAELAELKETDRDRIPENPVLDIAVPQGSWREIDEYTPVAEDLPLTYGVGSEGLKARPRYEDNLIRREALANQLKGFLLFFDQLVEGCLNQVKGVKELFSMNRGVNDNGKLLFDKTYFTANPLVSHPLDVHLIADQSLVEDLVQKAAESKKEFEERKNRFLDHLLARFCEQFTDYALLAYSMDGAKAGSELIKDKLEFLNNYPEISANRGKAFNARDAIVWSPGNVSGYEKRVASLVGINARPASSLFFTPQNFFISFPNFEVRKNSTTKYLKNITPFTTADALLENLENVVAAGIFRHNYKVVSAGSGKFKFILYADLAKQQPIATSIKTTYTSETDALVGIEDTIAVCRKEFTDQPGSNRKNLSPSIDAFFKYTVTADTTTDPPQYIIAYKLYTKPFSYTNQYLLLEGQLRGNAHAGDTEPVVIQKGKDNAQKELWNLLRYASDEDNYGFDPAVEPYTDPYRFTIHSPEGIIGYSRQKNFNKPLATILETSSNPEIKIEGSLDNNGTYNISNVAASGPNLTIEIDVPFPGTSARGEVVFNEGFPALTDKAGNQFIIPNEDLTDRLDIGDTLYFAGTKDALTGNYTIVALEYEGSNTNIVTEEKIVGTDTGTLSYTWRFRIRSITAKKVTVRGGWELEAVQKCVALIKSILLEREGLHLLEHVLLRPKNSTQLPAPQNFDDKLMSIHIDNECEECRITDIYSFVMSVVLPYWPNRFRNMHLRRFMEKTIRTEAPAHLAMNICWINPEQMYLFEQRYKKWLIANADWPPENTAAEWKKIFELRGETMEDLIEILEQTRTVYPEGRLHSCDESGSDALKGAVILNNTMLGNA